jgi:tetratricopeptide (TPR) repeat protein
VKYQQRDYAGALAAYEKAVEVFEYQSTDPKNFFPQKQLATVYNYIGQVHTDWAKAANVEGRGLHLQQAKENYQRALNILRQMEAQNALTEYERKFLEEVSAAAKQ